MKKTVIFVLLFLFFLTALPTLGYAQYTGVISVDTVAGVAGEIVPVQVRIANNNLAFSSMTVPLRYNNQYLSVDTVLFDGTIATTQVGGTYFIDQNAGSVRITYLSEIVLPLPTISATDGLIATIMFKISDFAPVVSMTIDSINLDTTITGGFRYLTRIELVDDQGQTTVTPEFELGMVNVVLSTGIKDDIKQGLPVSFALDQNYPNPFNPVTTIQYSVPKAGMVSLEVFNILGQRIRTLVDEFQSSGVYEIEFDGKNHPSGIYFYRLTKGNSSLTKKMVMIK